VEAATALPLAAGEARRDARPWPRDQDSPTRVSGHYIAAALFEHDIHHRADILHYLALLGVEDVPSRL